MEIKMKTCLIYTRKATIARGNEYNSIKKQKDECIKFAKTKGYRIEKIYSEIGSGCDKKRKGLQWLIGYCKQHKIDFVITADPERIARSYELRFNIEHSLRQLGTEIKYTRQPELNSPEDKFLNSVLAMLSKQIWIARSIAIKRGLAARKARLARKEVC